MKTHTTTDSQITPLHALAKRLEAWRASRSVGQRIPEELWQEAVSLAQIHGLSYTSTALNLYYYGLQRRMGQPRRSPKVQPTVSVLLTPARQDEGRDGRVGTWIMKQVFVGAGRSQNGRKFSTNITKAV